MGVSAAARIHGSERYNHNLEGVSSILQYHRRGIAGGSDMGKLDGELIVKRYMDRLYQDFRIDSDDEGCTITMPYMDRHRNFIQVYIAETASGLILSDYGDTISDLRICGLSIDNDRRRQALNEQLNLFGIELEGEELRMSSTWDDLPLILREFTQGMLAIGDLIHMADTEDDSQSPRESEKASLALR